MFSARAVAAELTCSLNPLYCQPNLQMCRPTRSYRDLSGVYFGRFAQREYAFLVEYSNLLRRIVFGVSLCQCLNRLCCSFCLYGSNLVSLRLHCVVGPSVVQSCLLAVQSANDSWVSSSSIFSHDLSQCTCIARNTSIGASHRRSHMYEDVYKRQV